MESGPVVTVCVSTRNRSPLLPRLMRCLEQQTLALDQFEVVIVDNGSDDDTGEVLERLRRCSSVTMTALRNPPGKGPAAGRNRAWRAARAPLCAFTDDDCMPTPTWLEHLVRGLAAGAEIGAGRILPPPADEAMIGPFSRVVVAFDGNAGWCATANLVVRSAELAAVDGFDEGFLNVAAEDTDLALRILALGGHLVFIGDAVVHHGVEATRWRDLVRDQQRWVDVPAIFARHPEARRSLLYRRVFWKQTHPSLLLLLVGFALARHRPSALLLAVPYVHERSCRQPVVGDGAERFVSLPGVLALDVYELLVMLRGSVRHRSLVL